MDVKGLGHISINKGVEDRRTEAGKELKSGTAADRDPNGQQQGNGSEEQREPLTEEEIQESFEKFKNLPVFKDCQLYPSLIGQNGKWFVIVKDYQGKVVRRFSAQELSNIPDSSETKKGVLLNKAM